MRHPNFSNIFMFRLKGNEQKTLSSISSKYPENVVMREKFSRTRKKNTVKTNEKIRMTQITTTDLSCAFVRMRTQHKKKTSKRDHKTLIKKLLNCF